MGRVWTEGTSVVHTAGCGPEGARAPLRQYLLDPVLPWVVLLCMSALTVATIVLVVVTTANMGIGHSGGNAGIRWASSPVFRVIDIGTAGEAGILPFSPEMEAIWPAEMIVDDLFPVARWTP